ncbi:M23 family metallopeptidase [Sphingomonas sp. TZW2008]|uniref:M23 family metallopeptidase n=1 Tax=Sphingomonas sp. TZW2008 TaxID=1917973 RepID=UPI000A26B325|nr:M23 family metallopeptidase [Sphingomonas sp. TZW2008]
MTKIFTASVNRFAAGARAVFAPRHVIFHDGQSIRRIRLGGVSQSLAAGVAATVVAFAGYGAASATGDAAVAAGLAAPVQSEQRLATMERKLVRMQARVATIRETAEQHAARIEQRQALLAAALTGEGDEKKLALATLKLQPTDDRLAAYVVAPFGKLEQRQATLAGEATRQLQQRYAMATREIRKLGLRPDRIVKQSAAMGGPLIPAASAEATADLSADAQFRSLFMTWKKLDTLEQGVIAIPSVQPVQHLSFTSNFGIRSDPFRGSAAMHAGVDIPGPTGTPIYATADGIISHAERQGGYGNMVEINHGKGIATRYGHLSKIIVTANGRVRRGQIIGLMGSTGRSTGPHLHYEVRIDGHAVNPVPFLTTADYLLAAKDRSVGQIPVSATGPAAQDGL